MINLKDQSEFNQQDVLRLSTDVVSSYLSNNAVSIEAVSEIIRSVYASISSLGKADLPVQAVEKQRPSVPISKSIQEDYIVCLEDGKHLKMLKRYLRSKYDMSPDDYRSKWGLASDYPMVAPAYANRRSEFAKQIGLGRGVRTAKS